MSPLEPSEQRRTQTFGSAGLSRLSLPSLDVPADPLLGAPTGRVFIVEPIEDPVPPRFAHEGEDATSRMEST